MTIQVRRAKPEEYDAVGLLTEQGYRVDGFLDGPDGGDDGYAAELRGAADRAANAELVVAVDGDQILGTVTWCPVGSSYRELSDGDDQGEFRMLAVSPDARRRGVARSLVQWCIDTGHAQRLTEIRLCSLPQMRNAHALYESLGFTRSPELDWSPIQSVALLGFRLDLTARTHS